MTDQDKKDSRNSGKDKESKENLFLIMDGIIYQLNTTKRIFILMILTIMIIPPMSFVVTFTLFGPSFPFDGSRALHERFGPQPQFGHYFGIAHFIQFLISMVWLGFGIRQWYVLSKWTRRYERYKELQRKLNQKLDNDDERKYGD
ncbi:MAG TPA: hypothetical protein VH500_16935 [Nitrososphaeraceae archaeon]|jgi:hypothetical protein